uniref:Transmembrane protein n=1 Tax=Glossina brevipalpis TaxID=37001 RepID=A0A1A9VZ91_9MUSC
MSRVEYSGLDGGDMDNNYLGEDSEKFKNFNASGGFCFVPSIKSSMRIRCLVRSKCAFVVRPFSVLLSSMRILIYIFDFIIFQHHMVSSFELQGGGFGCLLLPRYAIILCIC